MTSTGDKLEGGPVSVVASDRLCTGCGTNLAGRPIVREPRYDLLVASCPSCGRLAPFEVYPPHGVWLARWAKLVAALWVMLLLSMAAGGFAFVTGISIGAAIGIGENYDGRLRSAHNAWIERHGLARGTDDASFARFIEENGAGLGPTRADLEPELILILIFPTVGTIFSGIFWSLALLRWSKRQLLLGGGIVIVVAEALLLASYPVMVLSGVSGPEPTAWFRLWLPTAALYFAYVGTVFLITLVLTRPVARGFVRAFVPPMLRGALSFLWTSEGKVPPTATRDRETKP